MNLLPAGPAGEPVRPEHPCRAKGQQGSFLFVGWCFFKRYVVSPWAFLTFDDFKTNAVALLKRPHTFIGKARIVHKDVRAALVSYEAVSLPFVKPLNRSVYLLPK